MWTVAAGVEFEVVGVPPWAPSMTDLASRLARLLSWFHVSPPHTAGKAVVTMPQGAVYQGGAGAGRSRGTPGPRADAGRPGHGLDRRLRAGAGRPDQDDQRAAQRRKRRFHAVRPGTFGAGAPAARVRVRRPGADRRLPRAAARGGQRGQGVPVWPPVPD